MQNMHKISYGITREYEGTLFNDSETFDTCVLDQILELTGFQSIEDFNQAARDYDDDGGIPDAAHKKLLKLFNLNPADDCYADP